MVEGSEGSSDSPWMAGAKVTMSGQCSMGLGNRTPHYPHVKEGEVKASLRRSLCGISDTEHYDIPGYLSKESSIIDLGVTTCSFRLHYMWF